MQRLRFINSLGTEIVFENAAPYVFWKIQGVEMPPVMEIGTKAPGQNGYTLHSVLLDERTVRLSCHVHGVSGVRHMYELRKRVNAVCNPLLGVGRLVYENDNGTWQASAFCKGNPYGDKVQSVQTLDLSFECPGAFWLSKDPVTIKLNYVDGGLKFPIVTPGFFGTFGYRQYAENDGDAVAPVEFFIDGGAVNPVIKNETTGEFIKLSKQLESYDKLYINTDPEYLEVSLVTINPETNEPERQNAYGHLTPDSTLFKLALGNNTLTFTSDDGNKKVRIEVVFYKRFVGV